MVRQTATGKSLAWTRSAICGASAALLQGAGAGLRSRGEPWANTTSAAGRMVLTMFTVMLIRAHADLSAQPDERLASLMWKKICQ
jgi:hypothetical protein